MTEVEFMSVINMENFIDPRETALVGREHAKAFRKALEEKGFGLEKLEKEPEEIEFVIPDHIITINKSYFLGVFADRVRSLGKTGFKSKYRFKTSSEHILNKIDGHIDNALLQASPAQILNVGSF